jgi:preprotein translocase subunit SecG
MDLLLNIALIVHVIVAAVIIGLVLLQHGKGADMGAAFGSGSSGSLFGASGSANFLSRSTAALATVFFLTSLGLTWFAANRKSEESVGVMKDAPAVVQPAPAAGDKPAARSTDKPASGDARSADVPK